jgi:hypothetical protein
VKECIMPGQGGGDPDAPDLPWQTQEAAMLLANPDSPGHMMIGLLGECGCGCGRRSVQIVRDRRQAERLIATLSSFKDDMESDTGGAK